MSAVRRVENVEHRPGLWQTADGRFKIFRPVLLSAQNPGFRRARYWIVEARSIAWHDRLIQSGIAAARFDRRRDAIAAITAVLPDQP